MFRMRIEPELKEKLHEAIRNGKAKNMSELIHRAVTEFLNKQTMESGSHEP